MLQSVWFVKFVRTKRVSVLAYETRKTEYTTQVQSEENFPRSLIVAVGCLTDKRLRRIKLRPNDRSRSRRVDNINFRRYTNDFRFLYFFFLYIETINNRPQNILNNRIHNIIIFKRETLNRIDINTGNYRV